MLRTPIDIESVRMTPERFGDFIAAHALTIEGGRILALLTPAGQRVGLAARQGDAVTLWLCTGAYRAQGAVIKAWWPTERPLVIISDLDGSNAQCLGRLGPSQVICDLCNAEVRVRPVPVVGNDALCRACFQRTGLPWPGGIAPYVVEPAPRGAGR
jgi:hypothetical protein